MRVPVISDRIVDIISKTTKTYNVSHFLEYLCEPFFVFFLLSKNNSFDWLMAIDRMKLNVTVLNSSFVEQCEAISG